MVREFRAANCRLLRQAGCPPLRRYPPFHRRHGYATVGYLMKSALHWFRCLAIPLLIAQTTSATIVVNGLADKSRYDGSVSFTIVAEAGFTTTATFDGQPRTVGVQDTANDVGYHELFVSKQPSAGGAIETLTIRFIVRNPERISTEDGIPTWTPPPVVDDAPSAFAGGSLVVVVPPRIPVGISVPAVALLKNIDGSARWLNGAVQSTNFPSTGLRLLRGYGSGVLPAAAEAETTSFDVRVAGLSATTPLTFENATWTQRSGTLGGPEDWGANARVQVTNLLTIPAGAVLRIGAGSIVALAPAAEIVVNGAIEITGTLNSPVVFAPALDGQPWGGIRLATTAGSRIAARGAIFTGSGADATWFNTH